MKKMLKTSWHQLREAVTWESVKGLRHHLVVFLLVLLPLWWLIGSHFLALFLAAAFMLVCDYFQAKFITALKVRTTSKNTRTWVMLVNRVQVGFIEDVKYAQIQYKVFSDPNVYFKQAFNLVYVLSKMLSYSLRGMVESLFGLAIVLALFSPENWVNAVSAIQNATADSVQNTALGFTPLFLIFAIMLCSIRFALGSAFGFVNYFDDAICKGIRKHCGVAAKGSITLVQQSEGETSGHSETRYSVKKNVRWPPF